MLYRILISAAAASLCCTVAHATVVRNSAGTVQQVLTASDTDEQTVTYGTVWADLPGASVKFTIPPGSNQLLVAHFTANVLIGGGSTPEGFGQLRFVTGTRVFLPFPPSSPTGYNVCDTLNGGTNVQIATVQGSIVVPPGVRAVKVQYQVGGGGGFEAFHVSNWHLIVEAAPVQ